MLTETMVDIIGTIGAVALLSAYFWASKWECASDRVLYHLLNVIGAVGIGLNSYFHSAMPSAWLNLLWVVFGLIGLHRLLKSATEAEG